MADKRSRKELNSLSGSRLIFSFAGRVVSRVDSRFDMRLCESQKWNKDDARFSFLNFGERCNICKILRGEHKKKRRSGEEEVRIC